MTERAPKEFPRFTDTAPLLRREATQVGGYRAGKINLRSGTARTKRDGGSNSYADVGRRTILNESERIFHTRRTDPPAS